MPTVSLFLWTMVLGQVGPVSAPERPALPEKPSFVRHVLPILSNRGCASLACHGSFHGQNGFRLSLWGRHPHADYDSLLTGRVRPGDAEASLILRKPTLREAHRGGRRFAVDSWEYELLSRWIAGGAAFGADETAVRIEAQPSLGVLNTAQESLQLRTIAVWPDTTREDVSHLASYRSTDETVATVDAAGHVQRGSGSGSAQVVVRYGSRVAVITVAAPFNRTRGPGEDLPVQTPIDWFIGERLRLLNLESSVRCTDAEFLRRASLDVTGRLPSVAEVRAFETDPSADKRSRKVEELLARADYSWRWANLLALLSGCSEAELEYASMEMGVQSERLAYLWLEWLQVRVARDEPYDAIVAGMLLATSREGRAYQEYAAAEQQLRSRLAAGFDDGGLYASRQTNDLFWRRYSVIYDRQRPSEAAAEAFLGIHLECARCHDHPTDRWTKEDHDGFAATFQRVVYSELPLERSEKEHLAEYLAGGGGVGMAGLLGLSLLLYRRGRRRTAAVGFGLLGVLIGLGACIGWSYAHLASRQPEAQINSPGLFLAGLLNEQADAANRPAWVGLAGGLGLALVVGLCAYSGWRIRRRRVRLAMVLAGLAAGLAGAGGAALADTVYVLDQAIPRNREPLAHALHRRILHALGYGGCGQQPREIFVADRNFTRFGTPRLLDGTPVPDVVGQDPRQAFVDWMRRPENPYLARNLVNRVWAEYFGRGLVDPVDDLSESNPASHPELLDWLVADFVAHGWSLKHLHRTILNSATYQRSWRPTPSNAGDNRHYARFPVRRLRAEPLTESISSFTGMRSDLGWSGPPDASAFQTGGIYPTAPTCEACALRTFGRLGPANSAPHVSGTLFLAVDERVRAKIRDPQGRLARLLTSGKSSDEILDELYQSAFARRPEEHERQRVAAHLGEVADRQEAWEEVAWALLNTQEFQSNH